MKREGIFFNIIFVFFFFFFSAMNTGRKKKSEFKNTLGSNLLVRSHHIFNLSACLTLGSGKFEPSFYCCLSIWGV